MTREHASPLGEIMALYNAETPFVVTLCSDTGVMLASSATVVKFDKEWLLLIQGEFPQPFYVRWSAVASIIIEETAVDP